MYTPGEYEEPEVEPSALEQRATGTHDGGMQYNFVQREAEQQEKQGSAHRLGNGIEIINVRAGGALSQLMEAILKGSAREGEEEEEGEEEGEEEEVAQAFPSVEPGMPISRVLQHIQETLSHARPTKGQRAAARRAPAQKASDRVAVPARRRPP